MKILILAIIIVFGLSTCFAQCDSIPISVTVKVEKEYVQTYSKKGKYMKELIRKNNYYVKSDSVNEIFFDISIAIKNNSDTTASITLMSCSWGDNFIVNNDYIYIQGHNCDNNVAVGVDFKPGETKVYNTTLIKSMKFDYPCKGCAPFPPVQTTKLGLILLNDVFGRNPERVNYYSGMEDKSTWTMVWSNALFLLSESEGHPKPLEFGIYSK